MAESTSPIDVLIADDLPALREPLAVALAQAGYTVRTAADGLEALQMVEDRCPDLILLDLAMPIKDGIACLREIRQIYDRFELPVIVLTAHAEQSLVRNVIELGVSDFFLKSSFSLPALFDKIRGIYPDAPNSPRRTRPSLDPLTNPVDSSKADSQAGFTENRTKGDLPSASAPAVHIDDKSTQLPPLRPLLKREELKNRLDRLRELKGFSPAVTHLIQTIERPASTLDQIVEAAGLDQALATRFLWLANSAAYSRGAQVTSLRKAIVRIGTEKMREAAVSIGILERFGTGTDEYVHYGRFWEHSITVASAAAEIVRECPHTRHIEPDVAFTAGLMHDIGRLMLLEELDELYGEVIQEARARHIPLHRAEAKLLLTNHAKVAEEPLFQWRFSARVIRPVSLHHLPLQSVRSLQEPDRYVTMALVLANTLSQSLLLGESGEDSIDEVTPLAADLSLPEDGLEQVKNRLTESWRDLRTVVLMRSQREWPDRVSILRGKLPPKLRPRFLQAQNGSMVGDFFKRLLLPVPTSAVNAWIIRAERPVDARKLLEEARAVEQQKTSSKPYPTILLTTESVDVPYEETRPMAVIRTPYCLESVIETLSQLI